MHTPYGATTANGVRRVALCRADGSLSGVISQVLATAQQNSTGTAHSNRKQQIVEQQQLPQQQQQQ
jgi:hypothetical protein